MELFNKITIAHFIWYLVPGLALFFFLLFPFLIINPLLAKSIAQNLGSVGIILLAIILGFMLDGLRLYRLRPNYNKNKDQFFLSLQQTIGLPNLDPYFIQSHISDFARQKKITGIGIHHAIWIMHGHLSMIAFLEFIFWIVALAYYYFAGSSPYQIIKPVSSWNIALTAYSGFALLFFCMGIRFHKIAMEDQKRTNQMFLDFAKQHYTELRTLLNARTP